MIREPLQPARPHLDAILPMNPTVRVGRRGWENDVILAYYQAPPMNAESSIHVLDHSHETRENRIPYQESLCWPDEEGVLHYGRAPLQPGEVAVASSNDTPTRFFELTDQFLGGREAKHGLFVRASLSRPVAAGSASSEESIKKAIKIISEDKEPLSIDYRVEYRSAGSGQYYVDILAPSRYMGLNPIWAEYRTLSNDGIPIWVSEPLKFRSEISEESLGLSGKTYRLLERPRASGYLAVVKDRATAPASNGTAFLWRIRGELGSRTVYTGWFPGWVSSEESPKLLKNLSVSQILSREHPGSTYRAIEVDKLWGGSISVTTDRSNRPVAETDRKAFSGNVPENHDLVEFPHHTKIFVGAYKEAAEANVNWKVKIRGRRLVVNPNEGHPNGLGYGNGVWTITGSGGYSATVVDWDHTSVSEGRWAGGLPLYGTTRRSWVEARIGIWVARDVTITPKVANDDRAEYFLNGVRIFSVSSTRYHVVGKGDQYSYHRKSIPLKRGYNELRIRVEDKGANIVGGGHTSIDWDRSLHRALLDQGMQGQFWIGSGGRPQEEEWEDIQEGTTFLRWGDPPKSINPHGYGWPIYEYRFVDLEATGFPLIRVVRANDFDSSGKFTLQIEGPVRTSVGKTAVFSVSLTPEMEKVRIIRFSELLSTLALESISSDEAAVTYAEVTSNPREVATRFLWASDPNNLSTYRYFAAPDGSSRVSVKQMRDHSNNPEGWLVAWTEVPKLRIAKRHAFRTEDSSRISVLPVEARRTPEGPIPAWRPYVRPGRVVRELALPENVNTNRYRGVPALGGSSTSKLLWIYDIPEYFNMKFDPALPFRRVTEFIPSLEGDRMILLPHPETGPDPDIKISGVDERDIEWISPHSGTVQLKRLPPKGKHLRVSYIAKEDALPYYGYKLPNGTFMGLDLNPSRYHVFATEPTGRVSGHFTVPNSSIHMHPGTSIIGRSFTIYALPSRVRASYYHEYTESYIEGFRSSSVLASGSSGVQVSNNALRLSSGRTSGVAYLKDWVTEKPVRRVRISSAVEHVNSGESIRYEIWTGSFWAPLYNGSFVLLNEDTRQVRIRITLESNSGQVRLETLGLEAVGVYEDDRELASWDQTLFHTDMTPEELVKQDPLAIPLAVVAVGAHASPHDIVLTDARRRGGGLDESTPHPPRNQLAGYWDIGFWDGQAHLENGVIIVELPATVLKEHGGPFTHDQVLEQLHRHIAYGNIAIVRYKGEDGSWINR